MLVLNGKYTFAKIMLDKEEIEQITLAQIQNFLDHPQFQKAKIVIMPDTHAGKGAVIGFTMPVGEYICPNIIGVDIGCSIASYNFGHIDIDLKKFDEFVHQNIPSGMHVNSQKTTLTYDTNWDDRWDPIRDICHRLKLDSMRVWSSIGSLGGGNHFLEINTDDEGNKWVTVHTGSRNFGKIIAEHWQKKAIEINKKFFREEKDLAFLPMDLGGSDYLRDMRIAQDYAKWNHEEIKNRILNHLDSGILESIKSVHNYIDDSGMIRKGAISAHKDELVIIPFNMRDGILIAKGKGNIKWNESAPHGAGRIGSRTAAKKTFSMDEFRKQMEGIYSTCVNESTLDESPMAYKDKSMILKHISETVEPVKFLKPIYNFKAGE